MDILLFTQNGRKAEYVSLKLKTAGHDVSGAKTLAEVHHSLRHSDPDFIIVDSESFPEPHNDYRKIIALCRRKFQLYYDNELVENTCALTQHMSEMQQRCLSDITQAFTDIQVFKMLENTSSAYDTAEKRLFLKRNRLRQPHAQLLGCLLKSRGSDITAATLISLLWKDKSNGHQQTLYAYINQIRSLLESRNIPLVIERRMKGAYRISIKKATPEMGQLLHIKAAMQPDASSSDRHRFSQEPSCGPEALRCSS